MYRTVFSELFIDGGGITKSNVHFYTSFGQSIGVFTEVLGYVVSLKIVNEKVFVLSATVGFVPNDLATLTVLDLETGSRLASVVIGAGPVIVTSMHVTPDKFIIVNFNGFTYVFNEDCGKMDTHIVVDEAIIYGMGNIYFTDDFSGIFRLRSIDSSIISEFISGTRFVVSPRRDPLTLLYSDLAAFTIGIFDVHLNKTIEAPITLADPVVCIREGLDGRIYVLTCPLAPGAHIPFLYIYNDDLTYYGALALHDGPVAMAPSAFDFDDSGGIWLNDPLAGILRYKQRDGLFEWTDGSLNAGAQPIITPFAGGYFLVSADSDMSSHSYLLPYIRAEKVLLSNNVLTDISKGNVVRQEYAGFDPTIPMSMIAKSRNSIYEIQANSIKVFQDNGGYLYSFDVFEPDGFTAVIFLRLFGCSARYIIAYVEHADATKWLYWIDMASNSVAVRLEIDLLESIIEPKVAVDIVGNVYVLGASDIDPLKIRVIKYSMNKLEWESDVRLPVTGGVTYGAFGDGMMIKPTGIFVNLEDRVVVSGLVVNYPAAPPGRAIFYHFSDSYRLDGAFVSHSESPFVDVATSGHAVASNAFTTADACLSLYGDYYIAFVFFGGHNDIVDPGSVLTVLLGDGIFSSHLSMAATNVISSVRISVDLDNLPVGMFVGRPISEFIKFFQGGINADPHDDYSVILLNVSSAGIPIPTWKVVSRPFIKGVGK